MNDLTVAKLLVSAAALYLCACGAGDAVAIQEGIADDSPAFVEHRELAKLTVGKVEVSFLQTIDADGSERLWMQEVAPLGAAASPMDQLVFGEGLTALETFEALAPEAAAPVELSAAHAAQARSLGREDVDAVRQATFTATGWITRSIAGCESWVLSTSGGAYEILNVDKLDWVTGTRAAGTGWTNRNVTVGACNESTAVMVAGFFWHVFDPTPEGVLFFEHIGPTWSAGPPVKLKSGQSVRWYYWSIVVNETCNGLVCTSTPMAYRVRGIAKDPNLYHLRAAEMRRAIR